MVRSATRMKTVRDKELVSVAGTSPAMPPPSPLLQ